MSNFLPDTNIWVYAAKGLTPYSKLINQWVKNGEIILSSIVVAEFLSGSTDPETKYFLEIMDNFGASPIDAQVAIAAANYRRKYHQQLSDMLIAAQTKLLGATLVTNNKSDFPMSDIKILLK